MGLLKAIAAFFGPSEPLQDWTPIPWTPATTAIRDWRPSPRTVRRDPVILGARAEAMADTVLRYSSELHASPVAAFALAQGIDRERFTIEVACLLCALADVVSHQFLGASAVRFALSNVMRARVAAGLAELGIGTIRFQARYEDILPNYGELMAMGPGSISSRAMCIYEVLGLSHGLDGKAVGIPVGAAAAEAWRDLLEIHEGGK